MKYSLIAIVIAFSAMASDNPLDQIVEGTGPEIYDSSLIRTVRDGAFSFNVGIRQIRLPNVTRIGTGAFRGCMSLTLVDLPLVTDASKFAGMFVGCPNLANVYLTSMSSNVAKSNGFPWGATNLSIVFHFSDGDFNRNGTNVSNAK